MMTLYLITTVFGITCFAIVSYALPVNDENAAALYLQKFGYLEEAIGYRSGAIMEQEAVSAAIRDFQRFAGINETGEIDNETIAMMNVPRCGVKDKIGHSDSARKKRYALQGSKWRVEELTYRISKYPTRIKDRGKVENEISRAFKIWSDVTRLNFKEKQGRSSRVNIDIRFENGEHGDGDPFDGPGKTLAHAFFPQYGGDAHFDNEEKWTINERLGTNLFQVAAHEFGHSLGLSHSDEKKALMAPYYRGYNSGFQLHSDDIEAIQNLYGARDQPAPPVDEDGDNLGPPPDTSDAPDLCQDATLDTVTRVQNGSTYVFKGDFYWKVLSNGIADGYPRKITDDWNGLEGNLDASFTWSNGKTYFFKGGRYWRFTNKEMDSGYPKLLTVGFEGIPDMLDAALVWSGNGKTYFFKGDKYWRYDSNNDPPVSSRYPRPISNWNGLPVDGIDASFQWENSRTYFFKGDQYYRFNDITFEIDEANPPYPRSTAVWWFYCQSASQDNTSIAATEGPEIGERGAQASLVGGDLCQDATLDTVTRVQNGSTYVFKGDFYWKVLYNGIADGYPKKITDDWGGLEGNLDASFTWPNGKTYIFKGRRFWRFTDKKMDSGYPKLISVGFEGIPDMVDAAFVWSGNGKTYFFKGDKYWRYDSDKDPAVRKIYPKPISYWNGLPLDGIDAAFQWENNRTYFFKDEQYFLFNDRTFDVEKADPPYPRSTAVWWFHCQIASRNDTSTAATEVPELGSRDQTTSPVDKDAPNLCQDATLDTVNRGKDGITYMFKGDFYWKYLNDAIATGYPRKISDDWDGLQGNLDASFSLSNNKTFFFKGRRYWRFTNKKMDRGYPKLISQGFKGIPDLLDAALVWNGNGKIYFFEGDKYWRYDSNSDLSTNESVSKDYPMSITEWKGLPVEGIDAAVSWDNNVSYFFKGTMYYRYNDVTSEVDIDPPYPRSTAAEWFNC